MTPFLSWFKRARERWVGSYYEGPEPPARLTQMVIAFANDHPGATREEWARFAALHAAESYRSGYVRGVEYTERDEAGWRPDVPPEIVADALDPDWRWSPEVNLYDPIDPVLEKEIPEGQVTAEQLERMARDHAERERDGERLG